jgi:hypothetical protein
VDSRFLPVRLHVKGPKNPYKGDNDLPKLGAQLDMGDAWNSAMALLRTHQHMVLAVAGVLIFLPSLALGIIYPLPEPAPGADVQQLITVFTQYFQSIWIIYAGVVLLSIIGQIAIYRIFLGPAGTSVGSAMQLGLLLLPGVFLASFLSSFAIGLGALIFIVPGLYLYARLAFYVPYAAASGQGNPMALLQQSWRQTENNGWVLLGFLALIWVIGFVALAIITGILGTIMALLLPEALANPLAVVVENITGTAFALVLNAAIAAAYRQLAQSIELQVFE